MLTRLVIAGAFDRRLGPPAGPDVMTSGESAYPMPVTVDRLETFLRANGMESAARRVKVWEEADGSVWVSYRDAALAAAVRHASTPY